MASLLALSHELIHCIFLEIEPADLSALCRTCGSLNAYIRGNKLLCKELYLKRYDEPQTLPEPDWEDELHQATTMETILAGGNLELKQSELAFVSQQINKLLSAASPDPDSSLNLEMLHAYFQDNTNIDAFLCRSSLFESAGNSNQTAASTEALQQASARLHCLYGVPIDDVPTRASFHVLRPDVTFSRSPSACTRSQLKSNPTHTYARSKVYDLRQYTDGTLWGPFMDDGSQRVDWEKVEAVMIVLGFSLRKFTERRGGRFPQVWDTPFYGATPKSYIPPEPIEGPMKEMNDDMVKIRELSLSLEAQDPYGVTGTWMRVVCFLDYNDLYSFNFTSQMSDDLPRDPIDMEEGIIELAEILQVTKIESPGSRDDDDDDEEEDGMDWSNFEGERLPVVHFRGTSRSLHASWDPNANSRIRGTVRQTPEGEIRWTSFSIFNGEERWRSEGIQVGGLRSARGVLGNWFDKDFDMHGPAGPTAFWKDTDELLEDKTSSTPLAYY